MSTTTSRDNSRNIPQWLTREKDVIAHLYFAAAEIGVVEVEVGGVTLSGAITYPAVESRSFGFIPHEGTGTEAPEIQEGQVVRVFYGCEGSTYDYLTAISDGANSRRWQLEFPRTIERNQARIVRRHRTHSVAGRSYHLRIDLGGEKPAVFSLFDLSTAGMGFIFSPADHEFHIGRAMAGNLCLPGNTTIPVLIEARSLRSLASGGGQEVCGCRFIGIATADQSVLAQALADWRDIRHG